MTSWSDDLMASWSDDGMAGWSDDGMAGWSDDLMVGWSDDRQGVIRFYITELAILPNYISQTTNSSLYSVIHRQ